jgi:photosystem II stability/assembly factor-like uncharacterized protein
MVFRLGNRAWWVRFVVVVFVGFVVSWSSLLGQSQAVGTWQLVGADYYDVASYGDTVLFVGQYGGVLRSTDGGNRWALPYSGTYYDLLTVGFFDDRVVVAAGDGGVLLRSVDAGETWERVAVADSGYRSMSLLPSGVGYIAAGSGNILRSTDRGETWERVAKIPTLLYVGHAIRFVSAAVGVVVADSGRIYRTSDSGATWSVVHTDTSAFLGAVAFADALNGVVCRRDDRTMLRTSDGGITWWSVASPDPGMFPLSVAMPDTSTILLVGEIDPSVSQGYTVARSVDGGRTWSTGWPSGLLTSYYVRFPGITAESGRVYVSGLLGVALRSNDLGESWDVLSSAQLDFPIYGQATLRGVAFADDTVGVIPTDFLGVGEMLRTTDGGVTWVSGATRRLGMLDPHFFSSTYGMAGWNQRGSYFETTDAGKTWVKTYVKKESPKYFETWAVAWYDRDRGFKAGDSLVYRTTDGGKTWEGNAVPESYIVRKLDVVSPSTLFCITGVANIDARKAYRSTDSGRTWDLVLRRQDYLSGIDFIDDTTGFVTAHTGRMYRTTDGGQKWDSVLFEGAIPVDVRFFSRDNGMVVGANAAVYVTSDGGETWQPDWLRLDGPALSRVYLEQITLLPDRRTVIVAGHGCIARKVFPGALSGVDDPFEPEPERSSLLAVSPNPFDGGELTVRLDPSVTGKGVNVSLFDVLGRKVRDMTRQVRYDQAGGMVQVSREGLASGVYVVVLQANGRVSSRSVVVR